jgi:hypothetical protein
MIVIDGSPDLVFRGRVRGALSLITATRALWGKYAMAGVVLLAFSFLDGRSGCRCGGGGGGGDPASVVGTPTGTYSLTLTGTSPNTTAQVTLTLTVN